MTFFSEMVGEEEKLYSYLKSGKKVRAATYRKGEIYEINYNLEFNMYSGYYLMKKSLEGIKPEDEVGYLISEESRLNRKWNLTRVCINRREWLKSHEELKYQPCEILITDNPYQELEIRTKYSKNVEFLEKFILKDKENRESEYSRILQIPTLLVLESAESLKFLKYLKSDEKNLNVYGPYEMYLAFKQGYTDFEKYLYDRDIRKIRRKLRLKENDAKYFYKCYEKSLGLRTAMDIYNDSLKLAKEIGLKEIGFPKDLPAYERKLIRLKEEVKNKKEEEKLIEFTSHLSIKDGELAKNGYSIKLLNSQNSFSETAKKFHNCIYSTYYSDCAEGKYIVLLIKKTNRDYACFGLRKIDENYKFDQCYKKRNVELPKEELAFLKRNIKVEMRA